MEDRGVSERITGGAGVGPGGGAGGAGAGAGLGSGLTRGSGPGVALWQGLRRWPGRRWVAAAAVFLPLLAVYVPLGPSWAVWWASPAALVSAGLAALIVASYVPQPGSASLVDVGCAPCAALGIAAVFGSVVLRDTQPLDGGIAVVAVLLLVLGLVRRLTDVGACQVSR